MQGTARIVSAVSMVFAALYALPTLWWRFGRDQGLFESMGRGWLEGRLPYVAAWDQKPPGIHAVYALGAAFGGAAEWPIRALEIVVVLLTGLVVARLAGRDDAPVSPGVAALVGAGFHFTCFCWWHTGQVEPWEALAVLGSALAAERATRGRGLVLSGVLGGVAFLFKLPAVLLLVVIVGRLAWMRRAEPAVAARAVGAYALGGALAVLVGVSPWLLTGTFGALWELVVEYNAVYARHKAVHAIPVQIWAGVYAWPWLVPAFGLAAAAVRRVVRSPEARVRWADGLWMSALLLLAALGTVAMQPNNYMYHWSVVVPFVTLLAAVSANVLLDGVEPRPVRLLAGAAALVAFGLAFAPRWEQQHEWNYRRYVGTWFDVETGRAAPEALLEGFRARHMKGPGARPFGYVWADVERLSVQVRARAQAGDTLCARWFEPVFYTRTGLHCTSRFTTEHGWRDEDVPFKLDVWKAEHEAALAADPPTFMVTRVVDAADRALLGAQGYVEVATAGRYVALERKR